MFGTCSFSCDMNLSNNISRRCKQVLQKCTKCVCVSMCACVRASTTKQGEGGVDRPIARGTAALQS